MTLDPPPTDPTDPPGPYLTAEQIALELGVHLQTAQRYFREQGLPGRKIGKSWRTTRAAFDAWMLGAPPTPTPLLESTAINLETK